MSLVIEKAAPDDRPAIMALLKEVNMHYIPSPEMPALTYDNYFVARLEGRLVGFCGYKILSPTHAKTELMAVDKSCRGLGIGHKLQRRRMEDMLARGITRLTTNTDLPATIAWYIKHFDYKPVGVLKKQHEFGDPNIHEWTTLEVDLLAWNNARKPHDPKGA